MKVFFIEQLLRTIRQTAYSAYRGAYIEHAGELTRLPCIPVCTHTLRWRGGMWRCSGTGTSADSRVRSWSARRGPRSASRGIRPHRGGSGDRVTQRPVLTLTAAAAVRTPVIPVTGCTNTQSWGSLHTPQYILHWGQPREAVLYCGFTMVTGDVSTFLMDLYRFKNHNKI